MSADSLGLRLPILLWLGMPCVLFLLRFVRPSQGLPALVLLLVAGVLVLRARPARIAWAGCWPALVGALALLAIAGFPHGPFAWDWIKHWALLDVLTKERWPVIIELNGQPAHLRFYVAAYLVPALVAPWTGAALALAAWFGIGYLLLLRGVGQVAPRPGWMAALAVLLFVATAGADFVAQTVLRAIEGWPFIFGVHAENWWVNSFGEQLQLTSTLPALLWVPHQAIATMLLVVLLLFDRGRHALAACVLGFGLLALWSPFGMIGSLPLLMVRAWQERRDRPPALWLAAAATLGFAVLVAEYLSFESPMAAVCWECLPARPESLPRFMLFWSVELCLFILVLRWRSVSDPMSRTALLTVLAVTFLHGETTDLVMRVSLAPLAVLALRTVQALLTDPPGAWRRGLAVLGLVLTLPSAFNEATFHLSHGAAFKRLAADDRLVQHWTSTFAQRTDYSVSEFFDLCGWHYRRQYFSVHPPPVLREP